MQGDIFQAHAANNRLVMACAYEYEPVNIMTKILSYEEVISYDRLYESMMKCKHNVLWKDSVANFVLHSVRNISSLSDDLQNGTYAQREPYLFKITSPKQREILSVPFRDRVYQRSLNDNILYPIMTRDFILDNCACQFGKGNQFARQRLVTQLRRMVSKYGTDLYVLQIDIHGFYKNLSHDYVDGLFGQKLDAETYEHVHKIMMSQYKGDTGYNPGSQMIQIAGIAALNELDHFIKERLHVKCYVHYMDDLILVMQAKEHAERCKSAISEKLAKIGLEFNRKKTHIYPVSKGIDFLGFKFMVTENGKIIQNPLPKKIKNAKRKYKKMVQKSLPAGNVTVGNIEESYQDFRAGITEGNSYYSAQRMDKYYLDLWKGTKYEQREIQFIAATRKKDERCKRRKNKPCAGTRKSGRRNPEQDSGTVLALSRSCDSEETGAGTYKSDDGAVAD